MTIEQPENWLSLIINKQALIQMYIVKRNAKEQLLSINIVIKSTKN